MYYSCFIFVRIPVAVLSSCLYCTLRGYDRLSDRIYDLRQRCTEYNWFHDWSLPIWNEETRWMWNVWYLYRSSHCPSRAIRSIL